MGVWYTVNELLPSRVRVALASTHLRREMVGSNPTDLITFRAVDIYWMVEACLDNPGFVISLDGC